MFGKNYRNCNCMNNSYNYMNMNTSVNNEEENCGCKKDSMYDNRCEVCGNDDMDFMNNCQCGFDEPDGQFPENAILGQSYVPRQKLNNVYKECIGLKKGSMFPELVRNYEPCQSIEENEFLRTTNIIGEGCNKCQ